MRLDNPWPNTVHRDGEKIHPDKHKNPKNFRTGHPTASGDPAASERNFEPNLDQKGPRLIAQHWLKDPEIWFIASHILSTVYRRYRSSHMAPRSCRTAKKITWSAESRAD